MPKTTISDEQLDESEQRLRDGDKGALMDVLFYYIFRGLRIPTWVTVEFWKAYAKVHDGHASSWDDVFGKPWPGKHLGDLRHRKELAMPVWERVEALRAKQPVDDALFEKVADEFDGMGKRQVKELYYAVKKGIRDDEGKLNEAVRELAILNAKPRTDDP
jgi:hypothetical protein